MVTSNRKPDKKKKGKRGIWWSFACKQHDKGNNFSWVWPIARISEQV